MPTLTVEAPAKLNLTLDVLGRRADGYHDLNMVMQSVALSDTITLELGTGGPLSVRTNLGFLPNNEKNLAAAAALALQRETGRDAGACLSPFTSASRSAPAWGAAPPTPPPSSGP